MNFYNQQHQYYCGIDLHAKTMYLCILNSKGDTVLHRNIRNDSEYFLKLIEPYRQELVVGVECLFCWYWLADLCQEEGIPFVLAHALYLKAIHGGKSKNDKVDSQKLAVLLRGGMFPLAYVYPSEMRSARDLMRRRLHYVNKRAELLSHVQLKRIQYNMPEFRKKLTYAANREGVVEQFSDYFVRNSVETDLLMIEHYDAAIKKLTLEILRGARRHDPESLRILQTISGCGEVLALTLLYEIHDIARFPRVQEFLSYSRLVKPPKESGGKQIGSGGKKIGNAHLKWAFSELAILFIRHNEEGKAYLKKLEKKHPKPKALTLLAAKLGRTVYTMLEKKRSFDMQRFMNR